MKCYISGAITNDPDYKTKFSEAERKLRKMGYDCFNPVSVPVQKDWESYMRIDLQHLLDCDYIYRIEGWQKSRGARLENQIAEELGMKVIEIKELSRKW